MRSTFFAILFAFVAGSVIADEIDSVATNRPNGWNDNETGVIVMPQAASTEDVLQRIFEKWWFYTSQPPTNYIQITNFTILKARQVAIPVDHFSGARIYSYSAVLIQASEDVQVVVLLRHFDVYTSRAWFGAVFEVRPPPNRVGAYATHSGLRRYVWGPRVATPLSWQPWAGLWNPVGVQAFNR